MFSDMTRSTYFLRLFFITSLDDPGIALPLARIRDYNRRPIRIRRCGCAYTWQSVIECAVDVDRRSTHASYRGDKILNQPVFTGSMSATTRLRRRRQPIGDIAWRLIAQSVPLGRGMK